MKKTIFPIFLFFFVHSTINAQTFCFTPATSSNADLFTTSFHNANVKDNYKLRIYIHVIRKSDRTGGQSINDVETALNFLNNDFNPHGIFFSWDGTIDYIDADYHYYHPTTAIYSTNNHIDGIDIYLFDDEAQAGGRANGVGESSEFWVSGSFWDPPYKSLIKSHIISHEMGHVLFLWHTHHGTHHEGGDSNECAELVNGSNSTTCGDYIADTPADPHLHFNVNPTTCTWNGSGVDMNGDRYRPDVTLIMSYTHPDCMKTFTKEQGVRMRTAIATLPFLQNVVIPCDEMVVANRIINTNEVIKGCEIKANNVTIQESANVIIEASNNTIIEKNFEVELGATIEIK